VGKDALRVALVPFSLSGGDRLGVGIGAWLHEELVLFSHIGIGERSEGLVGKRRDVVVEFATLEDSE
jgi:hypothetical protein